jgi:3-dehydroquinate synthetase
MHFNSDNVVSNILGQKRVEKKRATAIQKPLIQDKQTRKTVNYAVGGGILGAVVGVPGLGVVAGVYAANKDNLENMSKNFDKKFVRGKK